MAVGIPGPWVRETRTGPQGEVVHAGWVEIGWALRRQFWGHGYATEIGRAGLTYSFDTLGMQAVVSSTAHGALAARASSGGAADGTMSVVGRAEHAPSRPGWLLDEASSAGRENLDAAHVERYDRKMDAGAADEIELLLPAGLGASSVVVDLGSGTGQFAVAVARFCRRVVAVDVSPVMLERLSSKVHGAGIGNVEVAAAGFLTYDHEGDPADIVYSRYALHHLPDFWKVIALRRVRSMLRDGGVFRLWDVVYNFDVDDAPQRIEAWCAPFGEEVEGDWARWEMEEHVRDEYSTFTWLLEAMFERTGFTIESVDYSDDGFDAKYLLRATPQPLA